MVEPLCNGDHASHSVADDKSDARMKSERNCSVEPFSHSFRPINEALHDLQIAKNRYEEEVMQLKKLSRRNIENGDDCSTLLEKLVKEKEELLDELRRQREDCEELKEKHQDMMECQKHLANLNETLFVAQAGDSIIVGQQRCLLDELQNFSKLKARLQNRICGLGKQVLALEYICSTLLHTQEVLTLYNKVWITGIWTFVQFILLCFTVMVFLKPFSGAAPEPVPT